MVSTVTGCCFARATTARTSCAMQRERSPARPLPLGEELQRRGQLLLRGLPAPERADVSETDARVVQDLRPDLGLVAVEPHAGDGVPHAREERLVRGADRGPGALVGLRP